MGASHDSIRILSDDQVSLLYGIDLEAVPAFRKEVLERAVREDQRRRVMGLLLESRGSKHTYTEAENELVLSPEFSDAESAAVLGLTVVAVAHHRRRLLRGNGRTEEWFAAMQVATREGATQHGEPWTEQEDQKIREYGGNLKYLAFELGRTYCAVVSRRVKLRDAEFAPEYQGVTE